MRAISGAIIILTGWLIFEPALAVERDVEIAPFIGLRSGLTLDPESTGADDAEADPSASWGLSVGWRVRPDGWLEVLFDRQTLDFSGGTSSGTRRFGVDVNTLQFGGGWEPPRRGARPYVTVAVGLDQVGADSGSVSHSVGLSTSIGAGVKVPLGRRAHLRLEARGWGTVTDSTVEVACGPGCSFSYSGTGWWQFGVRAAVAFLPGGRQAARQE